LAGADDTSHASSQTLDFRIPETPQVVVGLVVA
jgi:hypothetical protein